MTPGLSPSRGGGWKLCDLEPTDAPALAALHAAAFDGGEVWDAKAMSDLLAMPGAFGFLAFADTGAAAGFLLARLAGQEAEIMSLAVSSAQRRRGLGRCLLQALSRRVEALDGTRIFLEVAETNRAALHLYRGQDYREIGRRPGYYPGPNGKSITALVLAHSI